MKKNNNNNKTSQKKKKKMKKNAWSKETKKENWYISKTVKV